jgi:arsenate reductase (thioredoxin)
VTPIPSKPRVLILCTGNSCRSQMAEGFCRALHSAKLDTCSAGTNPAPHIDPRAVKAMAEVGIDIAHHQSKHLDNFRAQDFALVVTVCDAAHESCPTFPGAKTIHHSFEDPPRLAAAARTDDQAMPHYRQVRDQIKAFITTLPDLIPPSAPVR